MNAVHRWILAALVILALGALAAYESQTESEPQPLTPAQRRLERAAYDICTEQYGAGAAHRWVDGRLECSREVR